MSNARVRLIINGRVQGVWFRESTRKEAINLGVFGWVRNLPAGSVEVLAEGPEEHLNALTAWCRHGPPMARVDQVSITLEDWKGEFESFDIAF